MDSPRVTIFDDEEGKLEIQFVGEHNFLHFEAKQWSLSVYKSLLDKFVDVLIMLKHSGIETIHSAIPADDYLTQKFQGMFGMEYVTSNDEVVLFSKEL